MANIFYISSFGGSATTWLAHSLDLHEKIICFHGSRSFPQLPAKFHPNSELEGATECTPQEYAYRLAIITTQGQKQSDKKRKFAGAIHGFHGLKMHDPILSSGGCFAISMRHPILRIASLHQLHSRALMAGGLESQKKVMWLKDVFLYYREDLVKLFCNIFEPNAHDLLFLWIASETFGNDWTAANRPDIPIFCMEDYTVNRENFSLMFQTLTQGQLDCSPNYLSQVFSQGKINPHRKPSQPKQAAKIFSSWPERFSIIVRGLLHSFPDLVEFYANLGYPIDFAITDDPFHALRNTNDLSTWIRKWINLEK